MENQHQLKQKQPKNYNRHYTTQYSPNHLNNSSKNSDKRFLQKQQSNKDYLRKNVRYLESKISELEGCLFVTQWDQLLLEAKFGCQEQYSRRP